MASQASGRRARKAAVRNRKHRRKRAAQALTTGAAIAAGTHAYATPVRHDNPAGAGHFSWLAGSADSVLNILNDSNSQPGAAAAPESFVKSLDGYGAGEAIGVNAPSSGLQGRTVNGYGFLDAVAAGEMIPTLGTGLSFRTGGYIYTTYPYAYYYAGIKSLLPEGVPVYLGVKFDQGLGDQYGWIGVVRTGQTTDAFAWGYETDPGVPIPAGAPEPGTLGALALGAAAVLRRRR